MRSEKWLLFLTRDLVTVFPWKKGEVSGPPRRFPANDAGREALVALLAERRGVPAALLVDLVEEEFRTETQPHVWGPDRTALVQRRLLRAFPNTPFRYLELQGREEKKGRRDDLTLLSGITDPDLVLPWVEALGAKRLLLAGIHSLPMVGVRLLRHLKVVTPATLMVSWQSTSGLRFSFHSGHHLRMSRMAPVPGQDPESYAQLFVAELERTLGYLNSLRLVPKDCPIRVVLITSSEMLDAVRPLCQGRSGMTFDLMPVHEVARRLGIKRPITTPFSDSLFIQLLGQRRPRNHYANAEMTCTHHTWWVNRLLHVASVILVATAVVMGGMNLISGLGNRALREAKEQLVHQTEQQYRTVIDGHLPTSMDPAEVYQAVRMLDHLKEAGAGPAMAMMALSRLLTESSPLRLDSVTWKGPLHPAIMALTDPRRQPSSSPVPSATPHGGRGGAISSPKSPLMPGDHVEMIEFSGEIERINHDVSFARTWADRFVEALRADPLVYRVDTVALPGARKQMEVWAGDMTRMNKDEAVAEPFALSVILRSPSVVRQD
ncbi:MAG: hypothetical protein HQL83_17140 [Magnetococcales bacterium]|nr:hypothetical protein [Magnetococcales bacterium]MBF0629686.1 hypothetical protein [Magnetococcales bacterium]